MRRLLDSEVTPELSAKAVEIRKLDKPVGYVHPFKLGGVQYIAKVERHTYYGATGKPSAGHPGVSLYVEEESSDVLDILNVPGLVKTTPEFREELVAMCARLGVNPDHMATVMSFETGGTFNPGIQNAAGSSAVGLIQFMATTARNLGTTRDALLQMTAIKQLAYVEKYFQPYRGKLNTLESVYLAVFMPALISKPLKHVVARFGDLVYKQNAGFDRAKRGFFTVEDITRAVRAVATKAGGKRLPVRAYSPDEEPTLPDAAHVPTLRPVEANLVVDIPEPEPLLLDLTDIAFEAMADRDVRKD